MTTPQNKTTIPLRRNKPNKRNPNPKKPTIKITTNNTPTTIPTNRKTTSLTKTPKTTISPTQTMQPTYTQNQTQSPYTPQNIVIHKSIYKDYGISIPKKNFNEQNKYSEKLEKT